MVKSVCGYCGVGCSLEKKGDKLVGSLCAKGLNSLSIVKTSNRLTTPMMRNSIDEDLNECSWNEAISKIAHNIKNTSKDKLGFYLSGQLLTEDYYVANKLSKGFLGCSNIDTNSRTCMASAVVGYKKSIGADFVPLRMDDINKANLLILAGANTAESHVILHNKIKKAKKSGLKVVVIDPRYTLTAKIADIHIPIKINGDIDFFNLISKKLIEQNLYEDNFIKNKLNGFESLKENLLKLDEDEMLKNAGIPKELFEEFFTLYKNSKNIITAWTMGLNQSSQGVDKNLALLNTHLISGKIFKDGNGPFSLTGQPNAMGGREVGGLSTMLAVHLGFDDESVNKVKRFWGSKCVVDKAGLTATQMLEAELSTLIISHTDPIYHLPNRAKNEKLIKKIDLVVEINAYNDSQTAKYAHIILPALPWGEKEGTQTNLDRTISKQQVIYEALENAKADWEIFTLLAKELGFKKEFNFNSPKEIFDEYKMMTKLNGYMDICEADYDKLSDEPFMWGQKIKDFLTLDKKGNLFFVQNRFLSEKTSKEYPFTLLTGRTRDQWHSGTKTRNVDSLLKYKELEFCEINIDDAKELNIQEKQKIRVVSKRGELIVDAKLTKDINRGSVFIPISHLGINYLTDDLLDSESFEPDYNHSAIKMIKI